MLTSLTLKESRRYAISHIYIQLYASLFCVFTVVSKITMEVSRRQSSLKDPAPTKTRKSLFSAENLPLFFALLVENLSSPFKYATI